jgi:hypothetical protein
LVVSVCKVNNTPYKNIKNKKEERVYKGARQLVRKGELCICLRSKRDLLGSKIDLLRRKRDLPGSKRDLLRSYAYVI